MTILIIVVAVIVLWVIAIFNNFVKLRTRADEAWSDIDVQLKRRYDLIPNLVETVKGYASHEREVLENVTKARNMALSAENAGSTKDLERAENMLSGALKSLFAVSENYPDLKANQNFLELQKELADTENKIQASRRFYNSVVTNLNIKIDSFPSGIIGKMFGFVKKEFFNLEGAPEEREPVKVQF